MALTISDLVHYMFVDPAARSDTQQKRHKQRSKQAIVVIGVDWLERVFIRFAWSGRLPASNFASKIIDTYMRFNPTVCGIEANGAQTLFAELVQEEAKNKLGRISMRPVAHSVKIAKEWRIRTAIEPVLNQGRLFLEDGPQMMEMEAQLRSFPTGKFVDLVDALASCLSMIPKRRKTLELEEEAQSVLAYLRETGAPSWYIEQRARELRKEQDLLLRESAASE